MTNLDMQNLNRATMNHLMGNIQPGMSLADVRRICETYMLQNGADSFWYWDVGAFVFSGDQTAVSVSGRTYQTPNRTLEADDILTVDLSPQSGSMWGDYARTIIIQQGEVVRHIGDVQNPEWKQGLLMERELHRALVENASPEMTFEELYVYINGLIAARGFVNLDFQGNLGHSIERNKDDRVYTEKGNLKRLGDVRMFTFEPHISLPGSKYGYKREDIYFFENGALKRL